MADDISLIVGVDYSEMTGLIKTSKQTERALGAVAKEFARTGDQKAYMRSVNQIVQAQNRLDSASRLSRSEIMKLGAQLRQETKFTDALSSATNRLTTATNQAAAAQQVVGKRANRAGVLAQQAGYQFGDFAVQVQSGTNIMVAAGQQATQLVGTFSMLAKTTKGILAFSALGVIIPVITGLGAAFMRTRDGADTAADKAKRFEDALKAAREQVQAMEGDLKLLASGFQDAFLMTFSDAVTQAEDKLKDVQAAYDELLNPDTTLETDKFITEAVRREALEDAQKAIDLAKAELGYATEMSRQEQQRARDASIVNQLHQVRQEQQEKAREQAVAYQELVAKTTKSMAQQLTLAQEISDHGEDSIEVATLRADQEGRNLGLVGEELALYVQMARKIYDVEQATQSTAGSAKDLAAALKEAASAMASLSSFTAGLDKTLAVSIAKVEALRAGTSEAIAGQITGMRVDLAARLQAARDAGATFPELRAIESQGFGTISQIEANLSEAERLREANKSSGGGGDPFDQNAYLQSLKEEADFKRSLIGMTEEQATVEERRREIIEKLTQDGEALDETDRKRIETILKTEAETRRLIEAEENRQATMDMISGHIESAFMSMVDGSKSVEDAFKGMIRAILLEVYQQQVAKPMANAIVGALFPSANGNVFSGGNVIPFARGGVVSSATMFPMAGNQTGVMGEAGPEAIMPLKRGSDGKLGVEVKGGGGNVVVHQNFNFSANGDDSVKKIIAQAAPQIANMTQKQIMDARRRGGAMKSTFG